MNSWPSQTIHSCFGRYSTEQSIDSLHGNYSNAISTASKPKCQTYVFFVHDLGLLYSWLGQRWQVWLIIQIPLYSVGDCVTECGTVLITFLYSVAWRRKGAQGWGPGCVMEIKMKRPPAFTLDQSFVTGDTAAICWAVDDLTNWGDLMKKMLTFPLCQFVMCAHNNLSFGTTHPEPTIITKRRAPWWLAMSLNCDKHLAHYVEFDRLTQSVPSRWCEWTREVSNYG